MMAEAGVALVTHGAGGLTMPPIEMLRAAGVLVFAGNDDIRDTWSPYGNGDLLERAAIIGWKGDFRRDAEVEVAFELVSTAGRTGARDWRLRRQGRRRGQSIHHRRKLCPRSRRRSPAAQAGPFRRQGRRARRVVSGNTNLDHGRGLNVKAQSEPGGSSHFDRKVGGMISAAPRPAQSNPGTFSIARRCAICSRALASA